MQSPYHGLSEKKWNSKTVELIAQHPLKTQDIVAVVLDSWRAIFDSKIGTHGFRIGVDIFPKPQIMGFFLHELIPLEFAARSPGQWRGDEAAGEKDLVCVSDSRYSVEIKTSSHRSQVFGNRSYAQAPTDSKKSKSGYYIAVNFDKFTNANAMPQIRLIRFGWLDHTDWIGQASDTGQQARINAVSERAKLLTLFPS